MGRLRDTSAYFLGFEHKPKHGFSCGPEFTHFKGGYRGMPDSEANQANLSIRWKF